MSVQIHVNSNLLVNVALFVFVTWYIYVIFECVQCVYVL